MEKLIFFFFRDAWNFNITKPWEVTHCLHFHWRACWIATGWTEKLDACLMFSSYVLATLILSPGKILIVACLDAFVPTGLDG